MNKLPVFQSLSLLLPGFCNPSRYSSGCIVGAHMKKQQQIIVRGLYKAW